MDTKDIHLGIIAGETILTALEGMNSDFALNVLGSLMAHYLREYPPNQRAEIHKLITNHISKIMSDPASDDPRVKSQ